MKNNLGPSRRGKGAAVGLVICFVAVIALVGFFTFSRYKRDMSRQLAKAEEKTDTENKKTLKRQKRAKRQTVRQFRTKHRRQKNKKKRHKHRQSRDRIRPHQRQHSQMRWHFQKMICLHGLWMEMC